MHVLIKYAVDNHTLILLGLAYVFSAVVSAMPPLPANAGYWATWIHNTLQILSANINRIKGAPKEGA